MSAGKIEEIISSIESLSVIELSQLVEALKEKFGISEIMMTPAAGAAPAQAAEQKEEKTEFNVVITSVGDKKLQVLKEIRAMTQLGLKEAKELIDNLPSTIKENVPKEEAMQIKQKLEELGAKIELK